MLKEQRANNSSTIRSIQFNIQSRADFQTRLPHAVQTIPEVLIQFAVTQAQIKLTCLAISRNYSDLVRSILQVTIGSHATSVGAVVDIPNLSACGRSTK